MTFQEALKKGITTFLVKLLDTGWFVQPIDYKALNLPHEGTAGDANAGTIVLETTGDISIYNRHEFSIVVAPTSSAVQVLVSHDGIAYESTPIEVFDRSLAEGALAQSVAQINSIGNYYFEGSFKKWKLENTAGTTVAVQARGASMVK